MGRKRLKQIQVQIVAAVTDKDARTKHAVSMHKAYPDNAMHAQS